ncbi:ABC transporter permease subunit, partial [Desulfovibrio sp.]|uniref:ABC transporter permease subunit n=1 Tax=Desulfovibrio sp. TaxID=885 RepID=UPI002579E88B
YVAASAGNDYFQRMFVLKGTSQDPTDPFVMMGQITDPSDQWAIDGTVLQYKDELYFVWSGWYGEDRIQQNLYLAHMSDPCTIDSERVMLSFPGEVMVLAIVGMLGPGLENVVLACVVAKWPWYARMMRTVTLRYADRDFVRFARVAGYGTGHIIRRHLLPCAAGEISVLATLDTGAVILMVSALSFLGLGVQPPTPEWGMMLGEAREVMVLYPWQMLPPGLAILLVVAACNYLGDSLRDALDPRHAMHKEPVL